MKGAKLLAPAARRDLREAVAWMARDRKSAAEAFLAAVLEAASFVATKPLMGRTRQDLLPAPYRFWAVRGFPYLVVYNADRTPPRVLRVLHMARDLPPLLWDIEDQ